RWAAAAAVGAALAAAGLAWTGIVASAARWAAAELDNGRVPDLRSESHRPLSVAEAAAVLVAAQGCAHGALLLAGAPAHTGAAGALALHLARREHPGPDGPSADRSRRHGGRRRSGDARLHDGARPRPIRPCRRGELAGRVGGARGPRPLPLLRLRRSGGDDAASRGCPDVR